MTSVLVNSCVLCFYIFQAHLNHLDCTTCWSHLCRSSASVTLSSHDAKNVSQATLMESVALRWRPNHTDHQRNKQRSSLIIFRNCPLSLIKKCPWSVVPPPNPKFEMVPTSLSSSEPTIKPNDSDAELTLHLSMLSCVELWSKMSKDFHFLQSCFAQNYSDALVHDDRLLVLICKVKSLQAAV